MPKKPRKPRNWNAVAAHFRNSAGAMKDKKKKADRDVCRQPLCEECGQTLHERESCMCEWAEEEE